MNDAEDVCGCLACAVLCGVCCVAAAEEDKRERERAAAEATGQLKNPMIQVNPVAVLTPRSQKAALNKSDSSSKSSTSTSSSKPGRGGAVADDQDYYYDYGRPRSPPRRNARSAASYRSHAYLPPSQ